MNTSPMPTLPRPAEWLPVSAKPVDHLRRNPQQGKPGRVAETRELVLAGTPYIVVYRIEGAQVQIIAVIHGAQRWPDTF